jgi:Type IIA topoisomerase (DNA gyrase/topo II, topoisomerase IV), A subunit
MGVIGMNLDHTDEIIGMQLNTQGQYLLFVSENGMGKRTEMDEFTVQRRGGKGVKCYKITEKTGYVVGVKAVNEENEIMIITTEGIIIRLMVGGISNLGRITSGVRLINMDIEKDITVASIAKVRESQETTSDEDLIKQLEQELEEEVISDDSIADEDADYEDELDEEIDTVSEESDQESEDTPENE